MLLLARPLPGPPRRRAHSTQERIVTRVQGAIEQLDLVGVEAIGEHLVGDDGVRPAPGDVLDRGRELHGLRHRHLGRSADQHDRAARRVGQEVADACGLMPDRPHPAEPAEGAGRLQQSHGVAGGGAVDDHEPAAVAPAGEVPRLAHRDELACAGRGGDEVAKGVGAGQQRGARAPDVPRHPFLEGGVGIDRDAGQPPCELELGSRPRTRAREGSSQLGPRVGFAHDRPTPAASAGQSERRGHGALAHAALAGDEDHASRQQGRRRRRGVGSRSGRFRGVSCHITYATTAPRPGRPCFPARTRRHCADARVVTRA